MLFSKEELQSFLDESRQTHKDSPDLEKLVKKEFQQWLGSLVDELKETISNNSLLDPHKKSWRVLRAERSYRYFAKTYFPHYMTIEGECALHTYLAKLFKKISKNKDGSKNAVAAPRGHAKTTHTSIIFVLWCIVFKKKKYIVEISDAVELVDGILESIKAELEENPNLKADFPEACGIGKLWRIGEFITRNGVKVQAFGSGKRIRGIRYGVHRPDLVIIDDLENDINVRSRTQRDRGEEWLDEAVSNLGDIRGTLDILYIGTVLHRDSILARKLKSPFWNSVIFRSIMSYPKRMDLWEQWQAIYTSQGSKKALEFYENRKKQMDEGAVVLWPEALNIYKLMEKRAENKRSFDKEQQNNPNAEDAVFKEENISFYTTAPACNNYYMYVDPAGGKSGGDFTAITVLGVHSKDRKIYVCESIVKRIAGRETIKEIIKLQRAYRCKMIAIETNGGQFHLKEWLVDAAFDSQVFLPLRGVNNSQNKGIRIETLEIPISSGELLLHRDQKALINQLLDYPEGEHDDAPDSLAGAYALCKGGREFKRQRRKR